MTDIRTSEVDASDIVAMAAIDSEAALEKVSDEPASVTDEWPTQSELLRTGEQKREPTPVTSSQHGEGEHQMKGLFAEVNPIRPAMVQGDVERAIRVNVHQHGDALLANPGNRRDSRVSPGVNEHTDLAIANDTRVAGGRDVIGPILNPVDVEGVIKEEGEDIKADLLEQEEEGAVVVLPEHVDQEVPPFTDRIPVMEYDEETDAYIGPRELDDIRKDKDEAYEEVEQAVDPDPAERDEIEEYDATEKVETDPEALATEQEERSHEEAAEQAREEHLTPRPEDIGEEEPEIIVTPDVIVNAEEQALKAEQGDGGDDDDEEDDDVETETEPETEPAVAEVDDTDDDDGPPPRSATKGEWVDYVVANYDISRDDAEAQTKDELIETYGE